jgi:glucose/arabinose dehydrogenase
MKRITLIFIFIITNCWLTGQNYTSTTVLSGLQYPVAFDVAPDGRFFITEKGDGTNASSQKARILVYNNSSLLLSTFYDLSDSTISTLERGVLGIALDPGFSANHYVYVYYNHFYNNDERIRILRFTETANVGTNPAVIFDLPAFDTIHGHVGGNLHFRPSQPNHIYFTIGDLLYQQTDPGLNYANKITNPFGKVLRIKKDGSIPTDNPFYDDGNPLASNCDWIWSYGHRNPFDFCFSPVNDSLYCSENGMFYWDEVNLIHKGSFYGWAQCEGNYMNSSNTNLCNDPGATLPITDFGAPLPAVTGILFYSGTAWNSLNNHLLVADNNNGNIYDCTLGNAPFYNTVTNRVLLGDMTASGGLTSLKQSSDGCIYAMNGGYTTNGGIFKICPVAQNIFEVPTPVLSFEIYPNPAKSHISIDLTLSEDKVIQLLITDVFGKTIDTEILVAPTGKTTFITGLKNNPAGIYFIQLKDQETNQLLGAKKLLID